VTRARATDAMNHVFVSYADEDKRAVTFVCDALKAEGVTTWVSFRHIRPGENWDEAIERALAEASALVVIVSPSSVASRYVRAEVEEAIRKQKTVVPVIIEPVDIPLRWGTLQHVKWNSHNYRTAARKIAHGLPQATASEFREALSDRSRFKDVQKLIGRHTEWLPIRYMTSDFYIYRTGVSVVKGSRIDCFAAVTDTIGPRAELYYLGSPYEKPIYASGKASPELREMLDKIRRDCMALRRITPRTRNLSPEELFRTELRRACRWPRILRHYYWLEIHLIVGRRDHYGDTAKTARGAIVAKFNQELFPNQELVRKQSGRLEMMSYDRILDAIGNGIGTSAR
jgi:hypothetical protein